MTLGDVDEGVVMRPVVAEETHAEPTPSDMLRAIVYRPKLRLWPGMRTLSGSAIFTCGGLGIVVLAVAAALAVDAPSAPQLLVPPQLAGAANRSAHQLVPHGADQLR